jgi:hypothetical protein
LTLIPQILPLIDTTVKSVEEALPGFSGSEKFAAAEAKVNSILTAVETDVAVLSTLRGIVSPLINAAVAAFNAAGLFKKSPGTVAAAGGA